MIDDLPPEIIPFIFIHLPLVDLVNCRSVSKKFKFFVDKVKITELFINDKNKLLSCSTKWCHTNQQINFLNTINILNFNIFNQFTFNLKDLKSIIINFSLPYDNFSIHFINGLKTLNNLEIWSLGDPDSIWDANRPTLKLELPNLKILYLGFICIPISIDCPQMNVLFYFKEESNSSLVQIMNPDTVKHLEFDEIEDEVLVQFKNCTFLKCTQTSSLNEDILTMLPDLKQIVCDQEIMTDRESYQQLVDKMNHLIEEKTLLFKENVEIFFRSVKLLRSKQFEKYGFFSNLEIRSLK